MPLILAPSFTTNTREEVEEHLELVRDLRLRAALEFQQGKETRLVREHSHITHRLDVAYQQLGKALARLDREVNKVEEYLAKCEMFRDEADLVEDRITDARQS
jgi:hypothetical protein